MEETQEIQKRDEKFGKVVVIDALKKDILTKYEQRENNIIDLEKTLNQTILAVKSAQIRPDYEASLNLPEFGDSISQAQEKNIKLSRRLQFLSLQQQQAGNFIVQKTFSQPKNDLRDFILEFDDSLKNTTLLAQRITSLDKKYEGILNPLSNLETEINEINSKISKKKSKVLKNREFINETTLEITRKIQENDIIFEQKLKDLEKTINSEIEKSISQTEGTLENVDDTQHNEEESLNHLKTDLNQLLENLQNGLNKKIQNLNLNIDDSNKKSIEDVEQLQIMLDEEMNQIYEQRLPTQTLDDELEFYELEALISRFEQLQNRYNEIIKNASQEKKEENHEEKEKSFEEFCGNDHGTERRIRCFDDGTFVYLSE